MVLLKSFAIALGSILFGMILAVLITLALGLDETGAMIVGVLCGMTSGAFGGFYSVEYYFNHT